MCYPVRDLRGDPMHYKGTATTRAWCCADWAGSEIKQVSKTLSVCVETFEKIKIKLK